MEPLCGTDTQQQSIGEEIKPNITELQRRCWERIAHLDQGGSFWGPLVLMPEN